MSKLKSILSVTLAISLAGCETFPQKKKAELPQTVTPQTLGTSYDYTKPGDISRQSKPVWILPRTTSGWKKAVADDAGGEWRSGQYVAKIIEPGRWATLEEAELSGKPYIIPGEDRPVIPVKLKDQSPTSTGELNATTLEQKLAKLEKMASGTSAARVPSTTSVSNQAAIPQNITQEGKQPIPGLNIPGIGQSQKPPTPSVAPEALPEPKKISIPPPPVKKPNLADPSKKIEVVDEKGVQPKALPAQPPLSLPGLKKPAASYDAAKNQLTVGYNEPGADFSVKTPKGQVRLSYKEKGRVEVTFDGKTETVTVADPSEVIKVDLPN